MADPRAALKMPNMQAGEGLRTLMNLFKSGAPSPAASPPAPNEQITAELAYKLAQAAGRVKDWQLFKTSLVGLVEALEGVNISLSGEEK